jgi:hypothetical protein
VHKYKQHMYKVNTSVHKKGTPRMLVIRNGQNRCWLCIAVGTRSSLENANSNACKCYVVACRPVGFEPGSGNVGFCGGESGAGVGFLRVLRFLLPIFIPPIAPKIILIYHLGFVK